MTVRLLGLLDLRLGDREHLVLVVGHALHLVAGVDRVDRRHPQLLLLRLRQPGRLEEHELGQRVNDQEREARDPPHDDRPRDRLGDRLPAELGAHHELGADDHGQDPGLPAELVAVGVVEELEALAHAHRAPEEHEEEAGKVEPVVGLPPEDELEVEGVELGEEEDEDDEEGGQPALERGERVPRELDPAVGSVKEEL